MSINDILLPKTEEQINTALSSSLNIPIENIDDYVRRLYFIVHTQVVNGTTQKVYYINPIEEDEFPHEENERVIERINDTDVTISYRRITMTLEEKSVNVKTRFVSFRSIYNKLIKQLLATSPIETFDRPKTKRQFTSLLLGLSNLIAIHSHIGPATFIIMNEKNFGEVGTINFPFKIIIDNSLKYDTMIIGRKTKDMNIGIKLLLFDKKYDLGEYGDSKKLYICIKLK